jgi:UDP-N-acetylmuramate dehydrogenase
MDIREHVSLRTLTTLKTGGEARYVISCHSTEEVREALRFAKEKALPWYVLGEGSNVLAADEGYAGVVLLIRIPGIAYSPGGDGATVMSRGTRSVGH